MHSQISIEAPAAKEAEVTKGHVSARIPATDHVLILDHIHSEGRSLIDTDVHDLEGNWLEGHIGPVDEHFLHLEIMKARPDVTSVVHAHPADATAFGMLVTISACR
jgi:ribulose-5-phosphate 4-epimerase/fuculose-1-phosphate aldolase